jgi:hypothetical protein
VGLAIGLVFLLFGCVYCCKRLCPQGPTLSSLDLDEIRLERFDDIERSIKQDMRNLQSKLEFHRGKKAQHQKYHDFRFPTQDNNQEEQRLLEREGVDFESPVRQLAKSMSQRRREEVRPTELPNSGSKATDNKVDDGDMWKEWSKHSSNVNLAINNEFSSSRGERVDSDRSFAYQVNDVSFLS